MADDGTFYNLELSRGAYENFVFNVDISRLDEYTLGGSLRLTDMILMNTTVSLDAEITPTPIVELALEIPANARLATGQVYRYAPLMVENLRINAVSATIYGQFTGVAQEGAPPDDNLIIPTFRVWGDLHTEDLLRIYTTDGVIIPEFWLRTGNMLLQNGARTIDPDSAVFFFQINEDFNPANITAVYLANMRIK
jgi:hypothetical protein